VADWILTITAVILLLGGLTWLLLHKPRTIIAGDMDAPMNVERERAKSEAAMAAPVSEADLAEAAPLVAYVEEIGTNELPIVRPAVRRRRVDKPPSARQQAAIRARALAPVHAFAADPLAAPIPGQHRAEEPALFAAEAERWFAPSLDEAPRLFPDLPAEPPAWHLESFTQGWTKADVDRMVAKAKAGAR
jgi:hypothetical protein